VAVQPDDSIVVVGNTTACSGSNQTSCESDALIERYDSSGTPDPSFGGGDGMVMEPTIQAAAVALEPTSGKIVVGGTSYNPVLEERELAVARLNSDGSFDSSFGGGDGIATAPLTVSGAEGLLVWSGSMVLQPSGKVVLAGEYEVSEELAPGFTEWEQHPILVRFDADGTPDSSFGSDGVATGPRGRVFGLAEDSGGRLLTAGRINSQFGVMRFDASGGLDSTFGNAGEAIVELSQTGSQADSVLVEPGGKIVASGWGYLPAIVRFDADGNLDKFFGGGDGITYSNFGQPPGGTGAAIALARQPDGKIVFSGQWIPDEDNFADEWAVGRLYPTGDLDPTFGSGGLVKTQFQAQTSESYATGVALQDDGKILAVGGTGDDASMLALARYLGGSNAPEPGKRHILITKGGIGKGGVYAPELNCGVNCGASYEEGQTVELDAFAEWGSSFEGWTTISGDPGTCTGAATPCQATLEGDLKLEARFKNEPAPEPTLTINRSGLGSGTVLSIPAGINCGTSCSHQFASGSSLELLASPSPGSTFTGWSGGGCSGTGPCTVLLSSNVTVIATFATSSSGGGESPAGGDTPGGGGATGLPATAAPASGTAAQPGPSQPPVAPPLKCRKGFRKKTAAGKQSCVKIKKHRKHKRSRRR
jgi:uncharacterized delta-60 repeat protein